MRIPRPAGGSWSIWPFSVSQSALVQTRTPALAVQQRTDAVAYVYALLPPSAQQPPPGLEQGAAAEDHRHWSLPLPEDPPAPLQERLSVWN